MIKKEQVQESMKRIDGAVAQLNINREGHVILVNDLRLVQQCCMDSFDDKVEAENERNIKLSEYIEPGDENIEGGGDSV